MRTDPTALLHQHGLQVTPQRLAVLRAVSAHPHSTAEAVAGYARAELGAIARQSVYNALGALVDSGLLRRIQPVGSPALYEDRVGDNHHHLICRRCGRVEDIDCAVGRAPCLEPSADHGFGIERADVTYLGLCPACLAHDGAETGPDPQDAPQDRDRTHGRSPDRHSGGSR